MILVSMDSAQKFLGKKVMVKIDRPLGSKHPRWGFVYPVNYGFIPGTTAPDGEGIDAYVLGVDKPIERFSGDCIALIHRTDDDDDKLVIAPEGVGFSDDEIREMTAFQEQYFTSIIIR